MGDDVRLWLVERDFDDKGMFRLVYATPDGEQRHLRERSAAQAGQYEITAAIEVAPEDLDAVEEDDARERYAKEAARMRERHDPDDEI